MPVPMFGQIMVEADVDNNRRNPAKAFFKQSRTVTKTFQAVAVSVYGAMMLDAEADVALL